jgi:hypothetical protein
MALWGADDENGHHDNYVDRAISQIGLEGVLPTMDRLSSLIWKPARWYSPSVGRKFPVAGVA